MTCPTTKQISWKVTSDEADIIAKIGARAEALSEGLGFWYDPLAARMDLTACHANGNPLDLAALLAADDGTFAHDVLGIRRHLNRHTGKLEDFFTPRLSKQ